MPRSPDIGWKYCKMVVGQKNCVQCNYCQRHIFGGITRFKEHLASVKGEVKGCQAAPAEVRNTIKKHVPKLKLEKGIEKKRRRISTGVPPLTRQNENSLCIRSGKSHSTKSADKQISSGSRRVCDASSSVDQGSAPPRASDIGWEHCIMLNGDRQKVQCRYCSKVILGGGITRLKQHLAGNRGNITPCEEVPHNVKSDIKQHLGFKVLEKSTRRTKNTSSIQEAVSPSGSFTRGSFAKKRKEGNVTLRQQRVGKLPVPYVPPRVESTLRSTFASQECRERADIALAKFMDNVGIQFNAANLFYFERMADAVAAVGPGYKVPSNYSLQGKLLDRRDPEVSEVYQEIRKSWEITGCTIMVDRWKVMTKHIVINFIVYCPQGTVLLKSVDASDVDNCHVGLLSLFDDVVQEVGSHNIVNFITDTTQSYKEAGRVLMGKYKTFFWSTCVNQSIELILKYLSDYNEVEEVLEKETKIHQFIYNNEWVLNLMRKNTKGKDIFQHAKSEIVTKFLTLENMVSLKDCLHQMFACTVWKQSSFSKQSDGKDVAEIVLNPEFWLLCTKVTKMSKPLVTVLQLMASEDRPSMGHLYSAVQKARNDIILAFKNKALEHSPYLDIRDIAEGTLNRPLLAAASYLNPSIYYSPSFSNSSEVQKSLLHCVETLEPNLTARNNIKRDKAFYEDATFDFSQPNALQDRETLRPDTWWSHYASKYQDLQRFAVRILSQTCFITTSARNQDINENRLEEERLDDIAFV